MSRYKKIILLVILLIASLLIAYGLYYMFKTVALFGPTAPTATTTPIGQLPTAGQRTTTVGAGVVVPEGYLPTAGIIQATTSPTYYQPEPVKKISSDYAGYTSMSNTGLVRYHNALDGKFYSIGSDGKISQLSSQTFYNVKNVTWANTANKAVLEYPDDSKIIYDFDKNKQVTLPKHWQEFSFSPDSSLIAAKSIGLADENRWLVTINDDGTGTKVVEPMGAFANEVTVDWSPSGQSVAFSQTGSAKGADRREILLVGLHGENFKSLVVEGSGFDSSWSPSGQHLLYNVYSARSDYKPELWIVDAYGQTIGSNRQMLELSTWAEKCAFGDDQTIFCAVPRSLPTGAGMSPVVANQSYDDLYKIDLQSGLKTPISTGAENYTVDDIYYDSIQKKLIFTDKNKTGIYEAGL
ncbi:MAG: hypothetical protein ABH832_01615 [bacterium]